jgi:hypothetical protein
MHETLSDPTISGKFELATTDGYRFVDTLEHDLLVYATNTHQNILLGVSSNPAADPSALRLSRSAIYASLPFHSSSSNHTLQFEGISVSNDTVKLRSLEPIMIHEGLDISGVTFCNGATVTDTMFLRENVLDGAGNMVIASGVTLSNSDVYAQDVHVKSIKSLDDDEMEISGVSFCNGEVNAAVITVSEALNAQNVHVDNDLDSLRIKTNAIDSLDASIPLRIGAAMTVSNDWVVASNIAVGELVGLNGNIKLSSMEAELLKSTFEGSASNLRFTTHILPALSNKNIDVGTDTEAFRSVYAQKLNLSNVALFTDPDSQYLRIENAKTGETATAKALAVQLGGDDGENLTLKVSDSTGDLELHSSLTNGVKPIIPNIFAKEGNVGIGTSEPADRLTVQGNMLTTGDIRAYGTIHIPGYSNTLEGHRMFSTANSQGRFVFLNGQTQEELMRINANGRVGIGISPTSPLHVKGDLRVSEGQIIINDEILEAPSSIQGVAKTTDGIRFNIDNATKKFSFTRGLTTPLVEITGDAKIHVGDTVIEPTGKLTLGTHTSIVPDGENGVAFRKSSGNLTNIGAHGIVLGTGDQTRFTHMVNNVPIPGVVGDSNGITFGLQGIGQSFKIRQESTSQDLFKLTSTGNLFLPALAGSSGSTPLHVTSNGLVTVSSSDWNLKEQILPLEYGLDEICSLNPVSFKWKKEIQSELGSEKEIGLIAQEVAEVIPEIVGRTVNTPHLYVDYAKLVPVLVQSIKQLNDELSKVKKYIQCS